MCFGIHREIVSKDSLLSFEIDSNLLKRFLCNLDKNVTIENGVELHITRYLIDSK